MGNSVLKTDIVEVAEGTDSFRIIRCPDNRPAQKIYERFIAEVIDTTLIIILFYPSQIVSRSIVNTLINFIFNNRFDYFNQVNITTFFLTYFIVKSFYYYILYRQKCTTLGKKFYRLRVYRVNTQEPIGIIRIIIREIFGKTLTFLFFPFSFLWYLYDSKSRLPHDLCAGTMVVEELEEHNGLDY